MRILVAGGTSLIGEPIAHGLEERGHGVRVLSRWALPDDRSTEDRLHYVAGDMLDPVALDGAADGCDVVAHTVGGMDDPRQARRIHADGVRHLLRAAERAGVRRFVAAVAWQAGGGAPATVSAGPATDSDGTR